MKLVITNRLFQDGKFTNARNQNGITCWSLASTQEWLQISSIAFLDLVRKPGKPVVLFVHGFNNGLAKALKTAGEIEQGLPDATVVLFSWNSDGEVYDYLQDRAHAIESVPDLLSALLMFHGCDVICHSMGNLILDQALKKWGALEIGIVNSLAMVAADIEDTALRDPVYSKLVGRGEVFYCLDDGALLASTEIHPLTVEIGRLGLTGPVGGTPPNFTHKNCTLDLLTPIDPILKHSGYFQKPWFYAAAKELMGAKTATAS